jgi:site-specific DNA recombinase
MGLFARAKEGLYHGGANFPVGFDYVDGRLAINEYEALQVRKIYEWYLAGTSPEKIAERLRTEGYTNRYSSWSETAGRWHVLRILMSDVYLGTMRYAEVVVENAHPAIVSKEDFDKAQTIRLKRHEIYGDSAYQTKYLLVGMLHCAECGARYFVKHNYGGYKYYVCYSRARTNPRMITADHCENKNWRLDELEEVIEAQVKKLLISPKYYENLRKQHEKLKKAEEKKRPKTDADILREKVAKLDKQMGRLMDLYADEKLPAETISAKVDKIYREKLALVAQIEEIEPPEDEYDDTADDAETVAGILADFALIWDTSDTDERRKILTYLIKRIVLDGDSVKIEWNFLK